MADVIAAAPTTTAFILFGFLTTVLADPEGREALALHFGRGMAALADARLISESQ